MTARRASSTPNCRPTQPTTHDIAPRDLNFTAALLAAQRTPLKKGRHEYDTEFVKRIVCAYLNAIPEAEALLTQIRTAKKRIGLP